MIPCPAGMYSLGGAHLNCTQCPAGFACASASSSPLPCEGGMVFGKFLVLLNNFFSSKYWLIKESITLAQIRALFAFCSIHDLHSPANVTKFLLKMKAQKKAFDINMVTSSLACI